MNVNGQLRPKFHFTPGSGWMNDPNGLIYEAATGLYHLFFQYCLTLDEDQTQKWWGHAVSHDLMHWTELPPAIAPDELGGAWSGCCVCDADNTSALFNDTDDNASRLVALYTGAGPHPVYNYQKQLAAFSVDHGLTWKKYAGNPVIASRPGDQPSFDNRDPSVFRLPFPDGCGGSRLRWVMMIAGMWARLFVSDDLLHWEFCGDVFKKGGSHLESECPDIFPMQVNGDLERTVWVYSGAGRFFVVGHLDAQADGRVSFVADSDQIELNMGSDVMYAAQTYNDAPGGRRIFVYWMVDKSARRLAERGFCKEWDGFQSLPMEASLIERGGQYRLQMRPAAGFFSELKRRTLVEGEANTAGVVFSRPAPGSCELKLELPPEPHCTVSVEGRGACAYRIEIREDSAIVIDGGRAVPMAFEDEMGDRNGTGAERLELLIIRDGACLDVFSDQGGHAHALVLPKEGVAAQSGMTPETLVLTVDAVGGSVPETPIRYCLSELE